MRRRLLVPAVLGTALLVAPQSAAPALASNPDASGVVREPTTESGRRARAYGHMMRAVFAVRQGEVGRAVDEIERAVAMQPASADLLAESADLLRWTGRQREAEGLARRALALDPHHDQARLIVAEMAARRALSGGDDASLDEALTLYEALAEQPDAEPETLKMLVDLRMASGDLDAAVEAGRELVARRPGDLEAAQSLAQLLARLGRPDEALGVLIAYLARHPEHEELFAFVERQVIEREAWEQLDRILAADGQLPRDAGPLHRLHGEARLRLGDPAGAVESLERAIAAGPDDTRTDYYLGVAYQGLGRMAEAAATFSALVERVPDHFGYRRRLAEALEAQGRRDEAIAEFRAALRVVPEEEGASVVRDAIRQRLAALELARERMGEAADWLARLERPDQPGAAEIAAQIALAAGDAEAARRQAARLEAMERGGVAALVEAEAALADGELVAATRLFDDAIGRVGAFARHRAVRAWVRAGMPERAESLLRGWVDADGESAEARYALGVFLHQQERFADAERALRATIELEPRHAAALNFLGYSLVERDDRLEEALGMIRRAVEIDPWNGAFLDSLGWALFRLGRYDEAREPLELAARQLPSDPTILDHLGDLYLALERPTEAVDAWRRALVDEPDGALSIRAKIDLATTATDEADTRDEPPPDHQTPHAELREPAGN